MAKPEKDKKEDQEAPDDSVDSAEKKKGGLGLIPIALAAIVVAGGAGAGGYFLAPGQSGDTTSEESAENNHHNDGGDAEEERPKKNKHAKEKKKKKKKKDGGHGGNDEAGAQKVAGGAFEIYEDAAYYLLDPFVISIQPTGRVRHLKMSIVLETSPEHEQALIAHSYRIRDIINIYLRSVDGAELENPAAMTRLKTQIKRRVRLIMADDAVENVLITEFVLT